MNLVNKGCMPTGFTVATGWWRSGMAQPASGGKPGRPPPANAPAGWGGVGCVHTHIRTWAQGALPRPWPVTSGETTRPRCRPPALRDASSGRGRGWRARGFRQRPWRGFGRLPSRRQQPSTFGPAAGRRGGRRGLAVGLVSRGCVLAGCTAATGWWLSGMARPASGAKPGGPPLPMPRLARAGWGAFIRTWPCWAKPRLWPATGAGTTRPWCWRQLGPQLAQSRLQAATTAWLWKAPFAFRADLLQELLITCLLLRTLAPTLSPPRAPVPSQRRVTRARKSGRGMRPSCSNTPSPPCATSTGRWPGFTLPRLRGRAEWPTHAPPPTCSTFGLASSGWRT